MPHKDVEARKAYKKAYREITRDKYKGYFAEYNRTRMKDNYRFLSELKNIPCLDCGGTFPSECMDFDHVRGEKKFTLRNGMTRSKQTLLEEIAKCDIVCANCHRIRTTARARVVGYKPQLVEVAA